VPFLFRVEGPDGPREWTSEDFTLDEMCMAENDTRLKWDYLDPTTEAEARRAMIAVFFNRAVPLDEAKKRAGALTARQVRVEKVADDRPMEFGDGLPVVDPKDDGAAGGTT